MMPVTVIDYGIGNIQSVVRALEHCEATVTLSDDPEIILSSPRLILPGVGAFEDGMQGLADRNLIEVIKEYTTTEKPLLGICLGMQMLASVSEEFGEYEGLNAIPGRVVAIPDTRIDGAKHKIPHIGWAELEHSSNNISDWKNTILSDLREGDSVYMVHSFHVVTENEDDCLADCFYNGRKIAAVIRRNNIYGCQFHPERSGENGLSILRNFLSI